MLQKKYDYIITGTGCAGLSLAMHMIRSGKLGDKKILLADQDEKNKNDRTWCFWETGENLFQDIVYKQWDHLWFYGEDFYKELAISPFRYKMIRGIDFYDYCLTEIRKNLNFEIIQGTVEEVFSNAETGAVINGNRITCQYVFNSILFSKPQLNEKQHWLLQHFKGWHISTPEKTFDSQVATLMDFRISQKHGTSFCYVLPFNEKEALVEYTLFTQQVLEQEAYDKELKNYLHDILQIKDYAILGKEFGIIPMTNYRFQKRQQNIIHIGTAGGQTKGSSGYTFYFIQKHSKKMVESLVATGKPALDETSSRFHFYDSVLLNILNNNRLPGKDIFSLLFEKNKPADVLRFLNNESSVAQELKIISTLPTMPFLKAAIQQIF